MSADRNLERAAGSEALLRDALGLEYLTVGWNVVGGVVVGTPAVLAWSVALAGFGIDSFGESASGLGPEGWAERVHKHCQSGLSTGSVPGTQPG